MEKYIDYAVGLNASNEVVSWLKTTAKNHINKQDAAPETSEVEHIIDYLISKEIPKINQMSYPQALKKAEKWTQELIKKGNKIIEEDGDVEVVYDFGDGFRFVKLIGQRAYEREGALMRHCAASYYGRDANIYSLRDTQNNPHCTIEENEQIKGKGNGDIHPKYVDYVVRFLEHLGMEVEDSEMRHLGYINVSKFKKHLHSSTPLFRKKYAPKNHRFTDKNGSDFASFDMLNQIPLIEQSSDSGLVVNFSIATFVPALVNLGLTYFKNSKKSGRFSRVATSGNSSHVATSGEYSHVATSGEYSHVATSGYRSQVATSGNSSQVATSGNSSQVATSGYRSQVATSGNDSRVATSGNNSQVATSGNSSQVATSGEYSKVATSGECSQVATSGYGSQVAIEADFGVGAAIGPNSIIKGKKGCWITLAEYNEQYRPICVKSAQIDGKKLKEDVWYRLKNGEFVENKT